MKRTVLMALASSLAIAAAAPASAAIFIGVSINGGPVTQVATDGGSGTANYNTTNSGFFFNVSATGSPLLPGPTMLSQSTNISTAGPGTVDIYVTQTDLAPFTSGLLSSFTSNTITAGSATISSYYSAVNALFSGTPLQTATFTGPGTFMGANALNTSSPWSETVRYSLTFAGAGSNFNGTANLTAVPEPASWAMMIVGFGLMGGALRSRRTKVAFA